MKKPRKVRRSLRASIDAFCRYCIYDPAPGNGNWREQVTACPALDCPLYPVRPVSTGSRGKTTPESA